MDKVFDWIDHLGRGGGVTAALALLVLGLITAYEVGMRYAFNRPTTWAHQEAASLMVAIGMLGASYALLHETHVRVDVVLVRLPRRARAWLNLATCTLALVFFALLTYYGYTMSMWAAPNGSTSVFGNRLLPFAGAYWMVPIGALLVCLQLLSRMYRTISWLRGRNSGLPAEDRGRPEDRGSATR